MTRVPVIAFGNLSSSLNAIIKMIRKDRRIDLTKAHEQEQAVASMKGLFPCILISSITDTETLRMLTELTKQFAYDEFSNNVKTIISCKYNEAKLLQHLNKIGLKNIIADPVKPKNFTFKFDLLVKALEKQFQEKENLLEDEENSTLIKLRSEESSSYSHHSHPASNITDNDAANDVVNSDASVAVNRVDAGEGQKEDSSDGNLNRLNEQIGAKQDIEISSSEIGQSTGIWRNIDQCWIFISYELFYNGSETVESSLPLWVYRGEEQPFFDDEKSVWRFSANAEPSLVSVVSDLTNPIEQYLIGLRTQYLKSKEKINEIERLRLQPDIEDDSDQREYSLAPDIFADDFDSNANEDGDNHAQSSNSEPRKKAS